MGRDLKVFETVMTMACHRLFVDKVNLASMLAIDRTGTLFALSAAPQIFGTLRPFPDFASRQLAVNHVITAARAYLDAMDRPLVHRIDQPVLKLPRP